MAASNDNNIMFVDRCDLWKWTAVARCRRALGCPLTRLHLLRSLNPQNYRCFDWRHRCYSNWRCSRSQLPAAAVGWAMVDASLLLTMAAMATGLIRISAAIFFNFFRFPPRLRFVQISSSSGDNKCLLRFTSPAPLMECTVGRLTVQRPSFTQCAIFCWISSVKQFLFLVVVINRFLVPIDASCTNAAWIDVFRVCFALLVALFTGIAVQIWIFGAEDFVQLFHGFNIWLMNIQFGCELLISRCRSHYIPTIPNDGQSHQEWPRFAWLGQYRWTLDLWRAQRSKISARFCCLRSGSKWFVELFPFFFADATGIGIWKRSYLWPYNKAG